MAKALDTEIKGFINLAKGPVAKSLVNLFLSDQQIKKIAGKYAKNATPVKRAAVLGAVLWAAVFAYQSASKRHTNHNERHSHRGIRAWFE